MKRKRAIKHLIKHGKIGEPKYTKKDEKKIQEVIKKGKIYGDPYMIIE